MLELMKSLQGLQTMLERWIFPTNYTKEEKETCEQAQDEAIDLTPQQKFSNECLEVYVVIFGLIHAAGEIRKTERSL